MATIRAKLKQLRNADVRYISLVDRAATRIPFRVLKRDKENEMGIDLMGVFKSDVAPKPSVAALVVFAQKDEAVTTSVREAIKQAGFITDRVQKSDENDTLVYAQGDQPSEVHIVRLGDQVLASVAHLKVPKGWVGDLVEEHGFFPDLKMATAALYDQITLVSKSETPQADAKAIMTSFGEYLDQMLVLPAACFSLSETLSGLVTKADDPDDEDDEDDDEPIEDTDPKDETQKAETDEEKKKRVKKHPPSEMAPADEEDDQKPPPDVTTKAEAKPEEASDFQKEVLSALKSLKTSTTGLTSKLEAVATEQATQKKVLDEVVQKAETLGSALKNTVSAPPVAEDRPAAARMRVQKDDDPRQGNFDTAFLRRRR